MDQEINIKIKVKWLIPLLLMTIGLFLVWKLMKLKRGKPSQAIETKEKKFSNKQIKIPEDILKRYNFTTTRLKKRGLNEEIILPGRVSYDQENLAEIGARMDGRIVNVFVKEGDSVHSGSALASVTSVELGNQAEKYLKAVARLEAARLQEQRAKELYQQKIIPAKEYEHAYTEYKTVKTEVETGKNSLMIYGFTAREIQLMVQGKINYKNLVLRSPIKGTVTFRNALIGQSISTGDKLFTVANLSKLWIILDVYEKDLPNIKVNSRAVVYSLADKSQVLEARVAHVGEVVNPKTHTASIRLEVKNKNLKLKPGQTVSSKVVGLVSSDPANQIMVLPAESVHTIEGKTIVFIKNSEGNFEAKEVEVGRTIDRDIEIKSGILVTNDVVIKNSFVLKSEFLK